MKVKSIKAYLKGLPIIRSIGKSSPVYHVGGIWENRLGLQVYMVVLKNLLWRMRTEKSDPAIEDFVEVLREDGILMIENFLTSEEFSEAKAEYQKAVGALEPEPFKGAKDASFFAYNSRSRKMRRVPVFHSCFRTINS